MSIWHKLTALFSREGDNQSAPATPAPTHRGGGRAGGVEVIFPYGRSTALSVATVYRCIEILSDSVASLPVQYLKRTGGLMVDDTANRLHYLLNEQPDPNLSAFDFWRSVVSQILLDGNAYVVPVYSNVTFSLDSLVLCGRGTVSYDDTTDRYIVSDFANGISGTYSADDIIHIKGQIANSPKRGVGVIEYARLTLGIASTGDSETLNRFADGGNVRGLVTNDSSGLRGFGDYQDAELQKTAEKLDDRFRGGERIVSLPGQVDFKQISLSSTDLQFLESRKFTVREICRFFGVHPSRVYDDTSTNYKSVEMANVDFLSSTLNPLLRNIENELNRKLVGFSKYGKYKIQFDRQGLYACDLDSKVKYQTQTIAAGIYTVNEWRAVENKPPVEGGDRVMVSANLRDINAEAAAVEGEKAPKPKQSQEPKERQNQMITKVVQRTLQTAAANVHIREAAEGEAESRIIAGYAILFNVESAPLWVDEKGEGREVIAPEAITQELLDTSDIKFTMYHNREAILARSNKGVGTLSYRIDSKGVYFEFEAPRTARGDEALELVKRGDLTGCSFMFSTYYYDAGHVERSTKQTSEGKTVSIYRVVKITGLYDFTLAADPAYPSTSVEAREFVRSLQQPEEPEEPKPSNKSAEQVREMRAAANQNINML